MTHHTIFFLMCTLSLTTSIALWHTLIVINHMTRRTAEGIRWGYVLRATGLFMLLLAVVDWLVGEPRTWPWLLLSGVVVATAGSALLHIATRRACHCDECPVREAVAAGVECHGERGRGQ